MNATPPGRYPDSSGTPHIWWIVGIYLAQVVVSLIWLATFDWGGYMHTMTSIAMPNGANAGSSIWQIYGAIFTPAYLAVMGIGLFGYWVSVLLGYFDWKALTQRGVERPFHWAFSFISSVVYIIGRAVVARRRTGSGIAPMWIVIISYALYMIVSMVVTVVGMASVMSELSQYGAYR